MSILRVHNSTSMKRIAGTLAEAKAVLIFTHVQIDGDCFGSAMAVCRMLRRIGKEAWIVLNAELPEYLAFLTDDGAGANVSEYCTLDPAHDLPELYAKPDVCLAVDCSDAKRFARFNDLFYRGTSLCIDHHSTNAGFASMNYVNDCGANGENIWRLFRAMGELPSKEEGEALYTAIVTDTGRFQYSATTAETLRIVSHLYKAGIDQQKITIRVYQSDRPEKVALQTRIKSRMEFLEGGKAVLATMKLSDLNELGAYVDETEGVVEELRNVRGVEIACFIRESDAETVKVSLRSKEYADVSAIASKHGGGGHVRAAGCSMRETLDEACRIMKDEIREAL